MTADHAPTLVLHGCYNNNNFGDLLILDVMSRTLRERLGVDPISPWIHPVSREAVLSRTGGGWKTCLAADAVVFGGGGYFCDYLRRSLRYSLPARLWQRRQTPYVVVGIGAGPFVSHGAVRQFQVVCAGAERICARDEPTREILESWGVPGERIEVTADVVAGLTPEMIPAAASERAAALLGPLPDDAITLALHFPDFAGPRRLRVSPPGFERGPHPLMEQVVEELGRALRDRRRVVPIWLMVGGGSSTWDAIARACEGSLPQSRFVRPQDHWTTAALLGRVDGVITTRLHVGITAWALGTPCCAYASHGKTRRFYQQIGREAFVADAGRQTEVVGEWARLACDDATAFGRADESARARLRALAARNYEVAAERLLPALRVA